MLATRQSTEPSPACGVDIGGQVSTSAQALNVGTCQGSSQGPLVFSTLIHLVASNPIHVLMPPNCSSLVRTIPLNPRLPVCFNHLDIYRPVSVSAPATLIQATTLHP